jgi:hypothetical protein
VRAPNRPNQWDEETVAEYGAEVEIEEVAEVAKVAEVTKAAEVAEMVAEVAEMVAEVKEESDTTLLNSDSSEDESYEPPPYDDSQNTSPILETEEAFRNSGDQFVRHGEAEALQKRKLEDQENRAQGDEKPAQGDEKRVKVAHPTY